MSRFALIVGLIAAMAIAALGAEPASIGDLLQQGWQSEQRGDSDAALKAYASALALRPDDPPLNLKIAQILFGRKNSPYATYLVKALDGFQKDSKCPVDLKMTICSALMGARPRDWGGGGWSDRIYPPPYSTLPEAEQKRLAQAFPLSWFFPSKSDEMLFRAAAGEKEQALKLAREVALSGGWRSFLMESFTRVEPESVRRELAKAWMEEAGKSANPDLRMAALALYARLRDVAAFKQALPPVLQAASGNYDSLHSLAYLCREVGWAEESQKIEDMCLAMSDNRAKMEDERALRKLISEGKKEQATAKLRQLLADYPDSYYYVFGIDNLADMVDKGWGDVLVEFITPEMLENLHARDIRTNYVLIISSIYNQPRFDYWVKIMVRQYASEDGFCDSSSVNLNSCTPESKVWLFQQYVRTFPNSEHAWSALATAYIEAGYPSRAMPILQQSMTNAAQGKLAATGWPVLLMKAAGSLGTLAQVMADMWNKRESFPPSVAYTVAEQYDRMDNSAEAQRWLDDLYGRVRPETAGGAKGTNVLWFQTAYELRLRVLVKLGKKDAIAPLLAEAQNRYPAWDFVSRVQGLNAIAGIKTGQQAQRQAEGLKKTDDPARSTIPCEEMMRLAYTLVGSGKSAEAASIAASTWPVHRDWQKGLPLAVAMIQNGKKSVLPFVEWLLSVSPPKDFTGDGQTGYADHIYYALQSNSDRSLRHTFAVVAALLAPEVVFNNSILSRSTYERGNDDLSDIASGLASHRLNRQAMSTIFGDYFQVGGSAPKWVVDIVGSQKWSAAGLIVNLLAKAGNSTSAEIQQLTNALSVEQDWTNADMRLLANAATMMDQRGMRAEAQRALAIGIKHANEWQRNDLVFRAISLAKTAPWGEYASSEAAWAAYSITCRDNKLTDDARIAAAKALQLAKTPYETKDALTALSSVDPNALGAIASSFDVFTQGRCEFMTDVAGLVYGLVKKDHRLAAQALPILEKACAVKEDNYAVNHWADVAATEIWAGQTSKAVSLITARVNDDNGLRHLIGLIALTDMGADSRKTIEQAVNNAAETSGWELSYVARAMRASSPIYTDGTDDGLISLSSIIARRVETADGVVPVEVLDSFVNSLSWLADRPNCSPQLAAAWWKMTEAAIRKAATKSGDAQSIRQWLNQSVARFGSTPKKNATFVQQLSALAGSLN